MRTAVSGQLLWTTPLSTIPYIFLFDGQLFYIGNPTSKIYSPNHKIILHPYWHFLSKCLCGHFSILCLICHFPFYRMLWYALPAFYLRSKFSLSSSSSLPFPVFFLLWKAVFIRYSP